jgi:hypothetical protein
MLHSRNADMVEMAIATFAQNVNGFRLTGLNIDRDDTASFVASGATRDTIFEMDPNEPYAAAAVAKMVEA